MLIKRGELIAYADDLYIHEYDEQECRLIIRELQYLQDVWSLVINLNQTEILQISKDHTQQVEGIKNVK